MSALYDKGREAFLKGEVDWLTDTIKAFLIDTALYTVDLNLDEFLSDIPAGARVGTEQTLAGKTSTNGVADASDSLFPLVTGATVEAIVICKFTGVEATSQLLAYVNTGTGLPFAPSGGDINVTWNNGAPKIFKL
jgi:hypothetical protein